MKDSHYKKDGHEYFLPHRGFYYPLEKTMTIPQCKNWLINHRFGFTDNPREFVGTNSKGQYKQGRRFTIDFYIPTITAGRWFKMPQLTSNQFRQAVTWLKDNIKETSDEK